MDLYLVYSAVAFHSTSLFYNVCFMDVKKMKFSEIVILQNEFFSLHKMKENKIDDIT